MAGRIAIAKPRISATDTRRVKPPPKLVNPHYQTPEHIAWAKAVKQRARYQCQAPGCSKAAPKHQVYADHIVELRDGGDPLALSNGRCLCAEHHTLITLANRAARMKA